MQSVILQSAGAACLSRDALANSARVRASEIRGRRASAPTASTALLGAAEARSPQPARGFAGDAGVFAWADKNRSALRSSSQGTDVSCKVAGGWVAAHLCGAEERRGSGVAAPQARSSEVV